MTRRNYAKGGLVWNDDDPWAFDEDDDVVVVNTQGEVVARFSRDDNLMPTELGFERCEWWNENRSHPGRWENLPKCAACGEQPGSHRVEHPHTHRNGCGGYTKPSPRDGDAIPVIRSVNRYGLITYTPAPAAANDAVAVREDNGDYVVVDTLTDTPVARYQFDPDTNTFTRIEEGKPMTDDFEIPAKKTPAKKAATKKAIKVVDKRSPAKVAATKEAAEEKPRTRGQQEGDVITLALRARCSGFWVTSRDEHRTEQDLVPAITRAGYKVWFWDLANGIVNLQGEALRGDIEYNPPEDPDAVLEIIRKRSIARRLPDSTDRNVWILRDLPPWLEGVGGALTLRKLRNLLRPDALSGTKRNVAQAIIILTAKAAPPAELNDALMVRDWPLPDRDEIGQILEGAVEVLPDTLRTTVEQTLADGARDAAIDAAVGLSSQEVQATFAMSLIQSNNINPAAIAAEKKRLIGKAGLEWMERLPGGMDAVGGLENLKEWLTVSATAYTAAARAYGLRPVKGALLLGVPGCGKTHTAKAIATAWEVPLLRLDLGGIKSKYVGESEANLRARLNVIETFGRCVVLLDEIEKALAGSSGGDSDGGVSADALGTILSWMNDRQGEAFVLATANNVEALPPELLRKGRFSEIFWIDLPTTVEREQVLAAALRSHKRGHLNIDLTAVAEATETFSGAEIAELVPNAMFSAFGDNQREITTKDLLVAADQIVPMARTSAEKITRLRETWSGRARWASRVDEPAPEVVTVGRAGARQIDM